MADIDEPKTQRLEGGAESEGNVVKTNVKNMPERDVHSSSLSPHVEKRSEISYLSTREEDDDGELSSPW